ncbi:lipoprotein-anchoring transpeptidase ErfK/SrfK [Nocardioides ginsengisegetis]|uniref:Lipoprotein-anchoring transpeptidase ErfK/SrfK n=1 Tax=Nocardioides ginsengisegetis TaxID=661491 RepID=A0A7W3J0E7_9ACTN|nr:Ig-like domain-containing protein [Nocardioides ginsengisegetis]MBA8804002.1 lipoprotein-anchoring transpeptidase ErfK/SrfK [Nocardioides ginsengisegetis]
MTDRHRIVSAMPRLRRGLAGAATFALASTLLAACNSDTPIVGSEPSTGESSSSAPAVDPLRVQTSVARGARNVPVDETLTVKATGGELRTVTVTSPLGEVAGALQGGTWTATGRLEPGTDYTITSVSDRSDGRKVTRTSRFHTQDLTLAEQTFASVAPLQDETVGVGMPVIVTFDVPVTDKASMEKHMSVTASPRQAGTWHWLSSTEAHWRPRHYWKAGSDVSVDLDINSISAGAGVFGQEDRHVDFHIGDAHVYKVNAQTDQMQVFSNGRLLRTLPITTGKPGFVTRSGTKVIIEKFASKRMNSETVGIGKNSPEHYDLDNVQWAMRVTYSGEFIHAAPWSVADQGHANVSHGCTGMSTANAAWLYAMSRRGDVVEYTGTDRQMTLTNGYGDWNESFPDYRAGSALS